MVLSIIAVGEKIVKEFNGIYEGIVMDRDMEKNTQRILYRVKYVNMYNMI